MVNPVPPCDRAGPFEKPIIASADHEPADLLEQARSGCGLELTPQRMRASHQRYVLGALVDGQLEQE